MKLVSFVAFGQTYFYDPDKAGEVVTLKLGSDEEPKSKMTQNERIARIKSSPEYPFKTEETEEKVELTVCGEKAVISEMSDLDIFMWLQKNFEKGQVLY